MQVKIFDALRSRFSKRISRSMLDSIEDRVNRWLRKNPDVKVVGSKQSTACNSGESGKQRPRFGGGFAL